MSITIEITRPKTETVEVNLYQHWDGDRWIFIAEVVQPNGKKEIFDAWLNNQCKIVLTPTRYCDRRDHAWFRLQVKNHGTCHGQSEYYLNWNDAVKHHMLSSRMAHSNPLDQRELSEAFSYIAGVTAIPITFQ